MKLPKPTETLADCVWLPRILAKARLLAADALPGEFAERFCHPSGVDGEFLRFFDLTKEEILRLSALPDPKVVEWFLADSARKAKIPEWNHIAKNLGRPGFPMADRLPIALSTTYGHVAHRNPQTVFEVLEADEAG